ncbi:hypothetical protein PMZ80_003969 [Knufia obscura]|uniref:Uncharacterized protein n=2 Tax=Knufia TaxID=430999 RepID=A0AAN8EJI9_9EURO|nr:hypothetical protein PMZ80_003969 [Knufia obscura]KAK5952302.1 hypothetical protein OHC33_006775 [Knufia fluminis]
MLDISTRIIASQPTCPLLQLPAEIRIQILGYLLLANEPSSIHPSAAQDTTTPTSSCLPTCPHQTASPTVIDTTILRTCQQLYAEGTTLITEKIVLTVHVGPTAATFLDHTLTENATLNMDELLAIHRVESSPIKRKHLVISPALYETCCALLPKIRRMFNASQLTICLPTARANSENLAHFFTTFRCESVSFTGISDTICGGVTEYILGGDEVVNMPAWYAEAIRRFDIARAEMYGHVNEASGRRLMNLVTALNLMGTATYAFDWEGFVAARRDFWRNL